jgi:hypothetical protein
MHAVAKMIRVYPDGREVPIEAMMSSSALGEVNEGEIIKIRLWHGRCLEAEAEIRVSGGRTLVKLISKKENRSDAPPEATC